MTTTGRFQLLSMNRSVSAMSSVLGTPAWKQTIDETVSWIKENQSDECCRDSLLSTDRMDSTHESTGRNNGVAAAAASVVNRFVDGGTATNTKSGKAEDLNLTLQSQQSQLERHKTSNLRQQKTVEAKTENRGARSQHGMVPLKRVRKLEKRIGTLEKQLREVTTERNSWKKKYEDQLVEAGKLHADGDLERKQNAALQRSIALLTGKLRVSEGSAQSFKQSTAQANTELLELRNQNERLEALVNALEVQVRGYREQPRRVPEPSCCSTVVSQDGEWAMEENLRADTMLVQEETLGRGGSVQHRQLDIEELGFLFERDGKLMFRSVNNPDFECEAPIDYLEPVTVGDVVRMLQYTDGALEMSKLNDATPKPRRRVARRLNRGSSVRTPYAERLVSPDQSDMARLMNSWNVLVVGGDCPTRYTSVLGGLAGHVAWHSSFGQKEKLESMLGQAQCVITIETQMSHAAMWRIKELAKRGQFVWKPVKVKSQSAVVRAVLNAMNEQMGEPVR